MICVIFIFYDNFLIEIKELFSLKRLLKFNFCQYNYYQKETTMKNLSYSKKVVIVNGIVCLFLVIASLISLFFQEGILSLCVLICSFISTLNSFLLVKSGEQVTIENTSAKFLLFTGLRFLLMLIGLVLSAILIFITMPDEVNNTRYILVAIAALPYFVTSIVLSFVKQGEL